MNINDVVIQKVKQLKSSEFKATAIKIEFEAQLNRGYRDEYCEECDEGSVTCVECDGRGDFRCQECDGDGSIEDGEETIECDQCDGNGWINCDECDEGTNICGNCDGNYESQGGEWGATEDCHAFIMEELSHIGLAERVTDSIRLSHGGYTNWKPVLPLKYAEFYNDGSVDSELTATVMLDNPENVMLLPKICEAFIKLAEQIQGDSEIDVSGAGMHMALLNSPDGVYPSEVSDDERISTDMRFHNFKKSMWLLMPALFFLGTDNEKSRGLEYRQPDIGRGSHRSAIDFRNGALEYRFFDTCYDRPEKILDNVVVIANTIKHWSLKYTKHGLSKLANNVKFGVDNNRKLDRFYTSYEHLDLLNAGLKKLKPSYYTITDLKKMRNFKTTKQHIKHRLDDERKTATISYKEYEQRFRWQTRQRYYQYMAHEIDCLSYDKRLSEQEAIKKAKANASTRTKDLRSTKTKLDEYVQNKLKEFQRETEGRFTLREEA